MLFFIVSVLSKAHFSLSSFHEHTYTFASQHITSIGTQRLKQKDYGIQRKIFYLQFFPPQFLHVTFIIGPHGSMGVPADINRIGTDVQATPVPTATPAHLKAFPVFFQKEDQLRRRPSIDASSSQKRWRKISTNSSG